MRKTNKTKATGRINSLTARKRQLTAEQVPGTKDKKW